MNKSSEYKKAILTLLANASQPLDVEYIRTACKIGNWQTALKHGLELLYDGRIQGTRTSRGWIFYAKVTERKKIEPSRHAE